MFLNILQYFWVYLLASGMDIWYIFIKNLINGPILAIENLKKHF
jgi:hypothetical protein